MVLKKSHFAKILKNARDVFSNCVKTVNVGNNSFTGLSTISLLQTFRYQNELPGHGLSPSVLEIEFCPNMGMGVAIF